jgi:hypothetical protein
MSDFDAGDLPPDLNDLADRLRSNRYEAGALELDAIKTGILKRGSGRRVARGRRMRKRTFVTALIMFAAIGTGSAGAVGFGGNFAAFFSMLGLHHRAPAKIAPTTPVSVASSGTPSAAASGSVAPAAVVLTPTAFCIQYGCTTTTTVRCSSVIIIFGFTILPSRCVVTVTNNTNSATPTGTVVVTAAGAPTRTCTLAGTGPTASCTVSFGRFAPANLIHIGPVRLGLFSRVTANYLGAPGLAPSSGTTVIPVTLVVF